MNNDVAYTEFKSDFWNYILKLIWNLKLEFNVETVAMVVLISVPTKICILKGKPTSPFKEKSVFTILILLL